jgi:diguanylate cyclase (GGDEF)-like protein
VRRLTVAIVGGVVVAFVRRLDRFKDINDRFGHAAGDEALRTLVVAVTRRLRAGDAIGRLGGEESLVVLARATAAGATTFADDVRPLAAAETAANATPFTISVGVAAPDRTGMSAESASLACQALAGHG